MSQISIDCEFLTADGGLNAWSAAAIRESDKEARVYIATAPQRDTYPMTQLTLLWEQLPKELQACEPLALLYGTKAIAQKFNPKAYCGLAAAQIPLSTEADLFKMFCDYTQKAEKDQPREQVLELIKQLQQDHPDELKTFIEKATELIPEIMNKAHKELMAEIEYLRSEGWTIVFVDSVEALLDDGDTPVYQGNFGLRGGKIHKDMLALNRDTNGIELGEQLNNAKKDKSKKKENAFLWKLKDRSVLGTVRFFSESFPNDDIKEEAAQLIAEEHWHCCLWDARAHDLIWRALSFLE